MATVKTLNNILLTWIKRLFTEKLTFFQYKIRVEMTQCKRQVVNLTIVCHRQRVAIAKYFFI